jgi:hypothetical protein
MRKKIVAATAALLLLGSVAAYAFVAATASATVTVNEALYIDTAGIGIGTDPLTACTISLDKSSATCSITAYPGETGTIGITIANKSSAAITTTQSVSSSSSNVTITSGNLLGSTIAGHGSAFITSKFAVASDAAPGTATISLSYSR